MTYGRMQSGQACAEGDGAAVSHTAELVRGDFLSEVDQGPPIRPSGRFGPGRLFSPRGEGIIPSPLPAGGKGGITPAPLRPPHTGAAPSPVVQRLYPYRMRAG
jgi:hypothetical protein